MPDLDITRLTDVRDRVRRLDAQLADLRSQHEASERALVQVRRNMREVETELRRAEGEIVHIVVGRPSRAILEGYRQPKDEG